MSDLWAITVGNFDGIHFGHRALLAQTVAAAKKIQGRSRVITFHPHPAEIVAPASAPLRLFDLADQREQFELMGVDRVEVIEFTEQFSKTSAEDFFKNELLASAGAKVLWVGHDFHFGRGRQGDHELLQQLCAESGLEFHVLPVVLQGGQSVSSTSIRGHLAEGRLKEAEKLLGRPYYIRGVVVAGAQRGRSIGFPTANLRMAPEMKGRLALRRGVYVGRVFSAEQFLGGAVLNVGLNPTIKSDSGAHELAEQSLKIEVHVFDFFGDLYGKTLKVELIDFLRDERKFSDFSQLKNQIELDAERARHILEGTPA